MAWKQDLALAEIEVKQIDAQLDAIDKRVEIALREQSNEQARLQQSREIEQALRSRFSNQELFGWMVSELTQLHSSSFQLALEVARKAEVCFRRELGISTSNYVGTGHWNATRKGLLAADKLLADLDRMEVAFVERDRREFEITKHLSLKRLDPQALAKLRHEGVCDFAIPEVLFDLDFPGHHYRRIKGLTVSIPCVSGPHTAINGTLTLHRSQVRADPAVPSSDPVEYPKAERYVHERWTERIAFSGGREDGGMFTFDLRDPKYLPFEHRGVVSEWNLELAGTDPTGSDPPRPQFDWMSIADVVLTMRYTARFDSTLKTVAWSAATTALDNFRGTGERVQVALSFKHDAPDAWHAALTAGSPAQLQMSLDWDRFPYLFKELEAKVEQASVLLVAGSIDVGGTLGLGGTTSVSIGATSFTTQGDYVSFSGNSGILQSLGSRRLGRGRTEARGDDPHCRSHGRNALVSHRWCGRPEQARRRHRSARSLLLLGVEAFMRPTWCIPCLLALWSTQAHAAEQVAVAMDFDLDGSASDPDRVVESVRIEDDKSDYVIAADPDVCRLVDVTIDDSNASITDGTITVTGTDCLGEALVASYTLDGSGDGTYPLTVEVGSATGAYFSTVTEVSTNTLTGENKADNLEVGYNTDCPTQYVAYGIRKKDALGAKRVDPYAFDKQHSLVTTGGVRSTTLYSVKSDAPFGVVEPGDLLNFTLDGVSLEVNVVSKESDDKIFVDRPLTIERNGVGFRYKHRFISSDPGDGLWFPVSTYDSVSFLFDQDAEASDGNLITTVECRAGRAQIQTHSDTLDGDATAVSAIDLTATTYEACRVGLKFGTGDDTDRAPDVLHITMVGYPR